MSEDATAQIRQRVMDNPYALNDLTFDAAQTAAAEANHAGTQEQLDLLCLLGWTADDVLRVLNEQEGDA